MQVNIDQAIDTDSLTEALLRIQHNLKVVFYQHGVCIPINSLDIGVYEGTTVFYLTHEDVQGEIDFKNQESYLQETTS